MITMGKANTLTSNLDVIKELCEELEGFFEAFQMDRVWSTDNSKVTVCFTAEKMKPIKELPRAIIELMPSLKKSKEPFRY